METPDHTPRRVLIASRTDLVPALNSIIVAPVTSRDRLRAHLTRRFRVTCAGTYRRVISIHATTTDLDFDRAGPRVDHRVCDDRLLGRERGVRHSASMPTGT